MLPMDQGVNKIHTSGISRRTIELARWQRVLETRHGEELGNSINQSLNQPLASPTAHRLGIENSVQVMM